MIHKLDYDQCSVLHSWHMMALTENAVVSLTGTGCCAERSICSADLSLKSINMFFSTEDWKSGCESSVTGGSIRTNCCVLKCKAPAQWTVSPYQEISSELVFQVKTEVILKAFSVTAKVICLNFIISYQIFTFPLYFANYYSQPTHICDLSICATSKKICYIFIN